MDDPLDRLSLTFGRRLPRPLNWLASAVWWAVFAAAILSWWRPNGLPENFPTDTTLVPILIGLTILSMVRQAAMKRRDALQPDPTPFSGPARRTADL